MNKKAHQLMLAITISLLFLSCSSSDTGPGTNPACNYVGGDGEGEITIAKQGNSYYMHLGEDNQDIVLVKKEKWLYVSTSGFVTLRYDNKTMHYILSGVGERTIELCDPKELG